MSAIGFKTGTVSAEVKQPETECPEIDDERNLMLQLASRRIQGYILKYLNNEISAGIFFENLREIKRQFIDYV